MENISKLNERLFCRTFCELFLHLEAGHIVGLKELVCLQAESGK